MAEVKRCGECGVEFRPAKRTRRFCSKSCSSRVTQRRLYGDVTGRFWALVEKRGVDECWPFAGTILNTGYGQMRGGRHKVSAHRLSYELANGSIPAGLEVCHRCDNPPCVNPSHLFVGTAKDNALDRKAKGRGKGRPAGPLARSVTLDLAREIRTLAGAGETQRRISARTGVSVRHISSIVNNRARA